MGVKLPDFMPDMPMLYSFRMYLLSRAIVEWHEVTTACLPKFGRAAAAPHSTIHLSVTSHFSTDVM